MTTRSSSSSRKRKLCSSKQRGEKALKGEIKDEKIEFSENIGKLKLICNKCEKKFSSKNVLRIHEMFHSKCLELLNDSDEDDDNNAKKDGPPASENYDHQTSWTEASLEDQFRPPVVSTPSKKLITITEMNETESKVESLKLKKRVLNLIWNHDSDYFHSGNSPYNSS